MGLTLTTAPAAEPVSLAEAKAHLRLDASDEDTLVTALIVAARRQAEARTGRVFITQRWKLTADSFPEDSFDLPNPPLSSVVSLTYLDADGARQTLASTEYQVVTDELVGRVLPTYGKVWPACREVAGSIELTFEAGYGAAAAVPQDLKAWILLAIGTLHKERTAVPDGQRAELPRDFVDGLLDPYRIVRAC